MTTALLFKELTVVTNIITVFFTFVVGCHGVHKMIYVLLRSFWVTPQYHGYHDHGGKAHFRWGINEFKVVKPFVVCKHQQEQNQHSLAIPQQAKVCTCFLFFYLNIMNVHQYKKLMHVKIIFHIHCYLFFYQFAQS